MGFSFNSFQAALKINYNHLQMKGENQLSSLADSVNSKQKWKLRNTLGQSSGGFQGSQPFLCIFMCVAHFFSDTPASRKSHLDQRHSSSDPFKADTKKVLSAPSDLFGCTA